MNRKERQGRKDLGCTIGDYAKIRNYHLVTLSPFHLFTLPTQHSALNTQHLFFNTVLNLPHMVDDMPGRAARKAARSPDHAATRPLLRRFAARAASRLGCRVAGHTFIIGAFQSGTHVLRPGEHATWDEGEGVQRDAAGRAVEARWSGPSEPGTVSCLALDLPSEIGA